MGQNPRPFKPSRCIFFFFFFWVGGTNASRLHCKANAQVGQRILYKDMTSMYPIVNKFHTYPKGHAQVFVRDFKDIKEYFVIAVVRVLPQRGLFHPVLPYRTNGKFFLSAENVQTNVSQSLVSILMMKEASLELG